MKSRLRFGFAHKRSYIRIFGWGSLIFGVPDIPIGQVGFDWTFLHKMHDA